jgi:hypothetical protein
VIADRVKLAITQRDDLRAQLDLGAVGRFERAGVLALKLEVGIIGPADGTIGGLRRGHTHQEGPGEAED